MAQTLSIEQLNALLKQWKTENIVISKIERDDLDQTFMQLQKITYSKHTKHLDDYRSLYTLHLQGEGQVLSEQVPQANTALPLDTYNIPLDESDQYTFDGSRFSLQTPRGYYTIEKQPYA